MRSCKHFIWTALVAFLGMAIFSVTARGADMCESLYDINESRSLKPELYSTQTSSSLSLFPVPQDNAIGTNDLNNAITVLSFVKGKIKYDQYFKNAFSQVGGGGIFLPVFSPDTIGFGQVRRFVLYNFATKKHVRYRIAFAVEDTIEKIAVADAEKRHFIFEIESHNTGSDDPWDYTKHLLLMDLSGSEKILIRKFEKEKGVTWSVFSGKIFLYHIGKEKLEILNTDFSPSTHPLTNIIKNYEKSISFTRLLPHPFLPFAIAYAGDYGSTYITWRTDRDSPPLQLFSGAYDFSFSPDGKWVVFKKENFADDTVKTYLMPVSEKYPNYLGSPILLLDNYFNEYNCAWTTNPISFVGSSGHKLYRWELTNEAHPESDKPTFHDYTVEKDLEKLTREKKQGLGGKCE